MIEVIIHHYSVNEERIRYIKRLNEVSANLLEGIDMDDTICDTNENVIVEADKYDKEVLGGTGIKDINAYEFTEMMGWPKEMKGQFFADRLEYIMSHSPIKEGAKEKINGRRKKLTTEE